MSILLLLTFLQTEMLKRIIDFYFASKLQFTWTPIIQYGIILAAFFIFNALGIFVTKKLTTMVYENISLKVFTQFLKSQW